MLKPSGVRLGFVRGRLVVLSAASRLVDVSGHAGRTERRGEHRTCLLLRAVGFAGGFLPDLLLVERCVFRAAVGFGPRILVGVRRWFLRRHAVHRLRRGAEVASRSRATGLQWHDRGRRDVSCSRREDVVASRGASTLRGVIPAVIQLSFDPVLHIGDSASVRLATVALAVVLFIAILLAAWIAARTPADGPYVPPPGLRPDDLLFIAVGAVPGAVVAGRVGYVLLHADFYLAQPAAIVDPTQGSLSLSLVPLGGLLSAAVIVRLIEAPLGRWMHVAAVPMLFALALGKLAGVLSAAGQGAPSALGWATAYEGSGPWDSLAPGLPSHPSQAYEGIALLVVLAVLVVALARGAFAKRDGRAFLFAIAAWAAVRAGVATTWRDDRVAGPLRAEQLIDLGVVFVCLVALAAVAWRDRASTPRVVRRDVQWPDPGQRPPF